MVIRIAVEIQVQKVSGKFVSREEIVQAIIDEIEPAVPTTIYAGDDSEYEATEFIVEEVK